MADASPSRLVQDEQTPLLANRRSSVTVADLERHPEHYQTLRSTFAQDIDTLQLIRQRSRLASYPSLPDPEVLDKFQQQHGYKRRSSRMDTQTLESTAEALERGAGQGIAGAPEPQVGSKNDGSADPNSRFMNITPTGFYLAFWTILLGYFIACFDTTLMASSHPVITSEFDASKQASWLTTAFMITNTGFQPLWGRLSDTVGRKSVYMLVMTIFGATNLWCALSGSIESFIAARAVCGLGAGGTMSMGLVILNDLVTVEYRGIYISHVNIAYGLGSACGAAFGGILCDKLGWRWAFGIQVPVIVVSMIGATFTVPNSLGPLLINAKREEEDEDEDSPAWRALKNFDSLGLATLVLTVTFLILFMNLGGNMLPWSHPAVIVSIVLFLLGSITLYFVESRAKQPVMPLHLLTTPPTTNLIFANFLASIASNTVLFNVPLWFQAVKLTSATASGINLAAPSLGGGIAGILTGYIITYTARLKPMLLIGSLCYLAGSIALCLINQDMSTALSVVLITGTPLSQGFVYPASMMAAFSVSAPEEQAVVTTTMVLWRNLGIVMGVAISSLALQNVLRVQLEEKVRGPKAAEVRRIVRSSVRAVKDLPEVYRRQVIEAYAVALKLTFITALVASILLVFIVVLCKLPRLRKGNSAPAGE